MNRAAPNPRCVVIVAAVQAGEGTWHDGFNERVVRLDAAVQL